MADPRVRRGRDMGRHTTQLNSIDPRVYGPGGTLRRSWGWRKKGKARTPFGSRSSRRRFCEMRLNSLPSNALPVMKRAWNAERHARRDDLVPFGFGRIHVMPFKLSQRSGRCEGGWVAGDRRVTLATSTPKGGGARRGRCTRQRQFWDTTEDDRTRLDPQPVFARNANGFYPI